MTDVVEVSEIWVNAASTNKSGAWANLITFPVRDITCNENGENNIRGIENEIRTHRYPLNTSSNVYWVENGSVILRVSGVCLSGNLISEGDVTYANRLRNPRVSAGSLSVVGGVKKRRML
jgi:hypothetical protein